MRPEDVLLTTAPLGRAIPVPIDVELEALEAELDAAGVRGRGTLNGHRQPTRYFSLGLRAELLERFESLEAGSATRR